MPGLPFSLDGGSSVNFPNSQPLYQFFYWLVNTPGLGGIVLIVLTFSVVVAAIATFRWIYAGGKGEETETYSYPTPPLYHSDESKE